MAVLGGCATGPLDAARQLLHQHSSSAAAPGVFGAERTVPNERCIPKGYGFPGRGETYGSF